MNEKHKLFASYHGVRCGLRNNTMKLSIYNTHVPVTSQEQANRLKQICLDWNLPIWGGQEAFDYLQGDNNSFGFGYSAEFYIGIGNYEDKTEINETEFINLLKPLKNEQ